MKKKKDLHSISRRYYIQKIVGPSCIYQHTLNKSHLKGQKNNLQTKTDQIQRSNWPEAAYSLRAVEHIICIIYTCIHRIFNVYELELSFDPLPHPHLPTQNPSIYTIALLCYGIPSGVSNHKMATPSHFAVLSTFHLALGFIIPKW